MQNGESCKSLTYAMEELSNFRQSTNITVITVNITCNQTITKYPTCNLFPNPSLSVRIVGHNKAYITLNSSMTVTHSAINKNANINWAWIGLGFISGYRDYNNLHIFANHRSLDSLAILNCSIMTATWELVDIQNLVIKGSKFGQLEICPTLSIYTALGFQQVHFTFSDNSISDCSTDKTILDFNAILVNPLKHSYLAIVNCTFTQLKGVKRTREVATTSNPKNIKLQRDSELISVLTRNLFILSINSSRFTDNKYLLLVSLVSSDNNYRLYPKNVKLYIYNTIMKNNLATSVLVKGIQVYKLYPKMAIVLKDISVDGNTLVANTQWTYAILVGHLESSMFSFSNINEISIQNSSFLANQGTSLLFKKPVGTTLSLKGEIHFTNNTGVLGGACGLHNTHLTIQTNTEGNIIFEGNTGVYGGALYLDNAIISDKTCKMKVKFINNTATTSGNSVYFASKPQGAVPNCSFNDIQLTDVSSLAFNMKYKGESVFSLIPGQTIYINV